MSRYAVVYIFDAKTEEDERYGLATIVKNSKHLFDGQEGLKIYAAKNDAVETISYFLENGELPAGVSTSEEET